MLTALDHIIIGVNDLEQATEIFAEKLGLLASGGGSHPTSGTANRIIIIGDTYLELITVRKPAEAQQSILDRLAKGDGYLNFVLTSDDISADSKAMRQRGVAIIGPNPGELKASDGRSRAWSRTDVEQPDLTQHYPFLIQHDSTGAERRRRLAGWTEPPAHPLGAIKVLSTTIAVENLAEATPRFQGIYGLQPSEAFTGDVDDWEAMLTAFLIPDSQQSFELAEPLPLSSGTDSTNYADNSQLSLLNNELLPEPGTLTHYLRTFGESLCRITLGVQDIALSRRYLDAHGATYTYKESTHPVLWIHPSAACGAAIVLHEVSE